MKTKNRSPLPPELHQSGLNIAPQRTLFDDFTLLGEDAEGSDIGYAFAAQREVIFNSEVKSGSKGET